MIEVFKTNISNEAEANGILQVLISMLPESFINFDLEDCDSILRIQNCVVHTSEIESILRRNGFECEVLE